MQDFITWRDEWMLGIADLDNQHLTLADCLNRLVRECASRGVPDNEADIAQKKAVLGGLVDELYTKTREHFSNEESMMIREGYPGYAAHAREHTMLLGEFKATFNIRASDGACKLDENTMAALRSWLVAHVARSDREFANYLRNEKRADRITS
jgi:hemerythrin